MKSKTMVWRCAALLFCVWLVTAGTFSAAAETTTTAQTTTVAQSVAGDFLTVPRDVSVVMILIGALLILLAIGLLCAYIFGFPRWGLMTYAKPQKTPVKEAEAPAVPTKTQETPVAKEEEEAAVVSLEDLF